MSASARLGGTDQRRPPVPFRRIITCACATLIYLPQHLRWRGSQVVRQGSAKALCVGSIPTLASNVKVRTFGGKIARAPVKPPVTEVTSENST